jgi:hypothetical protein
MDSPAGRPVQRRGGRLGQSGQQIRSVPVRYYTANTTRLCTIVRMTVSGMSQETGIVAQSQLRLFAREVASTENQHQPERTQRRAGSLRGSICAVALSSSSRSRGDGS